jgi:nucleoside-diphosphate-sugar epimerase
MRVVVTGASGNVGTSVLAALAQESEVESVVGIARRRPAVEFPKTTWASANVVTDDLGELLAGADAVVHLAWLIQPSRNMEALHATNVEGSRRVFEAAGRAGVRALVYASSVGAYSEGPKDRAVDESWPTDGIPSSFYSRHKAAVERILDSFERENPSMRIVRLRPGLIFKREAATEIRRLFVGPFLPGALVRPSLIPFVPSLPRLRFQAVHSLDVGDAYRRAVVSDVRGAFNIAADPVLDPQELGRLLDARPLSVPGAVLRAGAWATWKLRLQPSPPGWIDMALGVPIMDTGRARRELGWQPRTSSGEALLELLGGMRGGQGFETPPLAPATSGPLRVRELASGVGAANPGSAVD